MHNYTTCNEVRGNSSLTTIINLLIFTTSLQIQLMCLVYVPKFCFLHLQLWKNILKNSLYAHRHIRWHSWTTTSHFRALFQIKLRCHYIAKLPQCSRRHWEYILTSYPQALFDYLNCLYRFGLLAAHSLQALLHRTKCTLIIRSSDYQCLQQAS